MPRRVAPMRAKAIVIMTAVKAASAENSAAGEGGLRATAVTAVAAEAENIAVAAVAVAEADAVATASGPRNATKTDVTLSPLFRCKKCRKAA